MEGLAPSLAYCLELELLLETGESVRSAIMRLSREMSGVVTQRANELLVAHDQCLDVRQVTKSSSSPFERALLEILNRGLAGEPILAAVRILKVEVERAAQIELDQFLAKLPLLSLFPLLFFLLPAFLILLFGPLFHLMSQGIS